MIAKITQGRGFKGVINYVLDKENARLLSSEGIRVKDRESIIGSFITQSQAKPISKPVAHISLNFSVQDKDKLTDTAMAGIAIEYMQSMGYGNTQYLTVRHHDREHPHCHLVINRIDNNGKRISDKNEKLRSTKVCMELTKKYGLYVARNKEHVNRHRLTEPDKTKYEIYDTIKATVPKCKNWKTLTEALKQQGITTGFRYNGKTDRIQGIRFEKNGYAFNGSQIDRSCSYSKIDFQLQQNKKVQDFHIQQEEKHFQTQSSAPENANILAGGLFNHQLSGTNCDPDEDENQRLKRLRKKKGFSI
jgi:hypothetical protein